MTTAPYRDEVRSLAPGVHWRSPGYSPLERYAIVCDASETDVVRRLERAVEERQWHAVRGRDKPFEGVLWQGRFEIARRMGLFAPVLAGSFAKGASQTVLEIQVRARGSSLGLGMFLLLSAAFSAGVFLVAHRWFALVSLVLLAIATVALVLVFRLEARRARLDLQRVVSPPTT